MVILSNTLFWYTPIMISHIIHSFLTFTWLPVVQVDRNLKKKKTHLFLFIVFLPYSGLYFCSYFFFYGLFIVFFFSIVRLFNLICYTKSRVSTLFVLALYIFWISLSLLFSLHSSQHSNKKRISIVHRKLEQNFCSINYQKQRYKTDPSLE
jgi:hypothetical protein